MSDEHDEHSNEVGYKKPPKHARFQRGQSGNPKGRPKDARNFTTELQQELNAQVSVTENGRTRVIKKRKVIAKQIVNKAVAGDLKATALLLAESRQAEQMQSDGRDLTPPSLREEDQLVIANIVKRIRGQLSPAALNEADDEAATDSAKGTDA